MKMRRLAIPFILSAAAGCANVQTFTNVHRLDAQSCLREIADVDVRFVRGENGSKTQEIVDRRPTSTFVDTDCQTHQRQMQADRAAADLEQVRATNQFNREVAQMSASAEVLLTGLRSPGLNPAVRLEMFETLLAKLASENQNERTIYQNATVKAGYTDESLRADFMDAQRASPVRRNAPFCKPATQENGITFWEC